MVVPGVVWKIIWLNRKMAFSSMKWQWFVYSIMVLSQIGCYILNQHFNRFNVNQTNNSLVQFDFNENAFRFLSLFGYCRFSMPSSWIEGYGVKPLFSRKLEIVRIAFVFIKHSPKTLFHSIDSRKTNEAQRFNIGEWNILWMSFV